MLFLAWLTKFVAVLLSPFVLACCLISNQLFQFGVLQFVVREAASSTLQFAVVAEVIPRYSFEMSLVTIIMKLAESG